MSNATPDPAIGASWMRTSARVLVIAGGVVSWSAIASASVSTFLTGVLMVCAASALTLTRVLVVPPKGTTVAGRLRSLWQNPWVLTYERRFFIAPVLLLAAVGFALGQSAWVAVLSSFAVLLGLSVVYLGSPHEFVNRVIARTALTSATPPEQKLLADSEAWTHTDLRTPPPGFPALPSGQVIAVVQNMRTKSHAVLLENAGARPEEWSRWSQRSTTWDTPMGRAEVEAHEIWDGRPEAIVTITLPAMVIVIEGVAGAETALANARLLTRSLAVPQADAATPAPRIGLFDRVLGYPLIPAIAAWMVIPVLISVISADVVFAGANLMRLLALIGLWLPLHCLALNVVGIVRPSTFRLDRLRVRRRAKIVFWVGLAPAAFAMLMVGVGFGWSPTTAWAVTALFAVALVTAYLIRDPGKARPGRRSRTTAGVGETIGT